MTLNGIKDPFHDGEKFLQTRAGAREILADVAHNFVKTEMPEQHQEFYPLLSSLYLGFAQKDGSPVAKLLVGKPGFVSISSARFVNIQSPGEHLSNALFIGQNVGGLGLLASVKRRNRFFGKVVKNTPDLLQIEIDQAYGNCPKYIVPREFSPLPASQSMTSGISFETFPAEVKAIIAKADTFFIASACQAMDPEHDGAADISHRGGPPGFIEIMSDRKFRVPDYRGNYFFNTFGNLQTNKRASILFVQWDKGNVIELHGNVEIHWDDHSEVDGPHKRYWEFELVSGKIIQNMFHNPHAG